MATKKKNNKKFTQPGKRFGKPVKSTDVETFTQSMNWEKLSMWIVFALVLLIYLHVFSNGMTNRDDESYILKNPFIRFLDLETIRINFTLYYMGNYHPLSMLCFALGYQLGGTSAWPYQLINLVLHLANVVLVYHFIKLLLLRSSRDFKNGHWMAVITALLFGIHTLHVESVAWISENKNVLYTMFFLLSLIQYLKYIDSGKWMNFMLTILFFLLSLFSKALAVSLPLCLLLIDHFTNRKLLSKKVLLEKIPFFALSVIFGIVAIYAQGAAVNMEEAGDKLGFLGRMTIACYGLVQYFYKLMAPLHLSAFYEYPVIKNNLLPWAYYIYPAIVCIVSIIFLIRRTGRHPLYFFGMIFFLINIFPVLQLLPVGNAMMADRYAYAPSIGFFLMISFLCISTIEKSIRYKRAAYFVFAAYVLMLGILTYNRIGTWRNSSTLWNDVLRKSKQKENSAAWYIRAGLNNDAGNYQDALNDIAIYMKAHPDDGNAYFQRAFAKLSMNDLMEAMKDLDKSEELGVKDATVYNNRGYVKIQLGDYSGAINDFNKALEMNKWLMDAYKGRADANMMLENHQKALEDLTRIIAVEPSNEQAYNNIGILYNKLGDNQKAMAALSKAISLKSYFLEALQNRVDVQYNMNDYKGAVNDLTVILSQAELPYAYYYRAKAYMQLGLNEKACADMNNAVLLGYYTLDQYMLDSCNLK